MQHTRDCLIRAGLAALLLWFGLGQPAGAADYPRYESFGSTYVSLDSWIYPAFDRLAALGYAPTAFMGLRPWTRQECARLVEEADELLHREAQEAEEARLIQRDLAREFAPERGILAGGRNRGLQLESVYTRFTGIAGEPLTDGFHFGQSIVNDYGRPYQEGFNNVTGFIARAQEGPFSVYVQGEYQHTPGAPGFSQPVRDFIAEADQLPVQPAHTIPGADRFRPLDTYVGYNFNNLQITFGNQSLWWGPGNAGPTIFSNNAPPIPMLRISRTVPTMLPWIFRYLGPIRTEFFVGKLLEYSSPRRAWIHGQKLLLKPTPDLEIGLSRTAVFAGEGTPLTPRLFYDTLFSLSALSSGNAGDRRVSVDFRYRLPGLKPWGVVFYYDSLNDDDDTVFEGFFGSFEGGRRALHAPGIYVARLPGMSKLDFRAEYLRTPKRLGFESNGEFRENQGQFLYWNHGYRSGYTNARQLLGSWVGREGEGFQMSSSYWASPRNPIQVGFRHAQVDPDFVPGGGSLNQVFGQGQLISRAEWDMSARIQIERWDFPLLSPNAESNVVVGIKLTYRPEWKLGPN